MGKDQRLEISMHAQVVLFDIVDISVKEPVHLDGDAVIRQIIITDEQGEPVTITCHLAREKGKDDHTT